MHVRKNHMRCETMKDVDLNTCSRSGGQSCGSRLTAHDKGHAEEREEWHDGQQPFRPQQRLVAPAATGFWAYCSFDLARMGEWEVRTFSQLGWVVLLVFTNVLGALMLFAVGRPQRR
jgi:hypothetical protein